MTTLNFNGTVEYAASATQTLLRTSNGANPSTYTNLKLSGTSTKTLGLNTTVNGTLTRAGTASLALSTFTLTYGASSTLEYAGSAAQTTADTEFPASGGPHNLTINNSSGITLHASRSVAGTLTQTSGNIAVGSNTLTVNGTHVTGTNLVTGAGAYTLASGATLQIGSTAGITASGSTGSIQTTTRSFDSGASYVYDGSNSQAVGNGLPSSVANLKIANFGAGGDNTVTGKPNQVVTGTLEIQSGIYSSHSDYHHVTIDFGATLSLTADITVSGNWTNNNGNPGSGLTANSNKVTFNGVANQTIGGTTSTTFAALEISNTGSTGSNIVSLDGSLGAANTSVNSLSVISGVFDQGTGPASSSLTTTGSGTVASISSGATWKNLGIGDLTLAGDVSNAGTINFNANGSVCGDADDIVIRSTNTTQRTWTGTGTFSMTDVDVDYQKVPGGLTLPLQILVNSGTDGTHNTGWLFTSTCAGPYTWVGGAGQDWTIPTNWSPIRATAASATTSDVLIFDGSVTPAPTVTNVPAQEIAALRLKNGVFGVTLNASGANTLTLSGATGTDLDIPNGTLLTLAGANALTLSLTGAGHQATIAGQLLFQGGAHRLLGANAGEITMTGTNAFTTSTGFTGNPFGTGSTNGVVVFQSGATGAFNAGDDPFGGTGKSIATFNLGSTARFGANSAFSMSDARTYGNLILDGNQTYTPSGSGEATVLNIFELESGSSLTLSGDLNLFGDFEDQNTGAGTFNPNGRTVKFQGGSATQTVSKTGNPAVFFHVLISKTGGSVQLLGDATINGALQFGGAAGSAVDVLDINSNVLTLNGTIGSTPDANSGLKGDLTGSALLITGSGAFGTARFISGGQFLTSLDLNRNTTVPFATNLTIGQPSGTPFGTLALTDGIIDMGSNTLSLNPNVGVTRTNGYVVGNLQRAFAAAGSKSFDVGTANGYSPVTVNATTGTFPANFTVKAIQGSMPGVSGTNKLARYWTLTNTTITNADLTFNYLASDVTGTFANYQFIKNSNGNLSILPPTGTPTNTSATINGVTSFSDWTLAEPSAVMPGTIAFFGEPFSDAEGNNVDHDVTITLRRSGGSDGAVSVHWATSAGTATAGTDYVEASGDVSWLDGDTADKTFLVRFKGDLTYEANETINLTLSLATGGATIGGANPATLTITNDDAADTDVSVSSGNLQITDSNGGNTDDTLTISLNGSDVRVNDPNNVLACGAGTSQVNTNTCDIPLASVTGNIQVDTIGGDDTLTLNLGSGDFIPNGLTYAGGTQTSAGDKLVIAGGAQGTVEYNYASANDGNIVMSNFGTVEYTGLEPITNTGTSTDAIFKMPTASAHVATLSDLGGGSSRLASTFGTFEQTDFVNPSNSLTISGGNLNDAIDVSALASNFPNLSINGGAGNDVVSFNGNITFAADANLDLNLQNDDPLMAPSVDSVFVNAQLIMSGNGTVDIQVSEAVVVNGGGVFTGKLQTENGTLNVEANQQALSTATEHDGVMVNGGTVQSIGTGNISIKGRGGEGAFDAMYGVIVWNGGKILSTGTGTITVEGTGGARTGGPLVGSELYGVYVYLSGSEISSSSGAIQITGQGGATNATGSYGVVVEGGKIQTSGVGTLTINGTGGTCTGGSTVFANSVGVAVAPDNAITPVGGVITSTGTGVNAGNIVITGIGADGGNGGSQGIRVDRPGTVTTVDGSMSFDGTGGACGNACLGTSIRGDVTATGTGVINITGVAGNSTGAFATHGVNVRSTGVVTVDDGNLTITGTGGNTADNAGFNMASVGTGSVQTTGTGTITVNADTIKLNPNASINAGANIVTLRQQTNGRLINLGSTVDSTANTLELSDTELNQVTAGTLKIGDGTSGALTVSADITRAVATNMALTSGGDVVISGGQVNTAGGTLLLDCGNSPAAVKPTKSLTDVTASTLSFGSDLSIVINGLTVDTDYTQLNVLGDVNLTGVTLVLSGSHTPSGGDTFRIVDNAGSNAITGTFNGLAEGATIPNFLSPGVNATISYVGGTGNDVVLTVASPCPTITIDQTTLSDGTQGYAYPNTTMTASGGTSPYTFAVTSGDLPDGLTLDSSGLLHGTPTAGGTFNFTVTVTDANSCTGSQDYTVKICPTLLVVSIDGDTEDINPGDGKCADNFGNCSLRGAIQEANMSDACAPITINFDIENPPGPPIVHTITPATPLPAITTTVVIDGYSQDGASANTDPVGDNAVLMIELSGANAGAGANGLVLDSGNGSIIAGLVINRFQGAGIVINVLAAEISGNFIGTDATGTSAGTNRAYGNDVGVLVNGSQNEVGCTFVDMRNVISGNHDEGVVIIGGSANTIQGNFIGTDKTGTLILDVNNQPLGNGGPGVEVYVTASDNIVGAFSDIGTFAQLDESASKQGLLARLGSAAKQSLLARIGAAAKRSPSANRSSAAKDSSIGVAVYFDEISGANIIAGNGEEGVKVSSNGDLRNLISQNSIYSNGGLGINLVNHTPSTEPPNTVTANDDGDGDSGPNALQNFPVITAADVATQTISGTLNTEPDNSDYVIEFFVSPAGSCDGSGYGEGKKFIGFVVTGFTDSVTGDVSFTFTALASSFAVGDVITATAQDASWNTSEFSACFVVAATTGPDVSVTVLDPTTVAEDGSPNLVYRFSRTDTTNPLTVNFEVFGSATFNTDYTQTGAATFSSTAGTVNFGAGAATADVTIDPTLDTAPEGDEDVTLKVVSGSGYNVTNPDIATGTIQDDDCPASLLVTSNGDSADTAPGDGHCDTDGNLGNGNQCTLRAAIEEVNALNVCAGFIEINFNISGGGVHTITPGSPLPAIQHPVTINGYSQPGAIENTSIGANNAVLLIELTGLSAGSGADGLVLQSGGIVIKGLVINRFGGVAIRIPSFGNEVIGNFIGTDATGMLAADGNGPFGNDVGVRIYNGAVNQIGCTFAEERNIISGNLDDGVQITGMSAFFNFVQGNFIGVKKDGVSALGNGGVGIEIYEGGVSTLIGGETNPPPSQDPGTPAPAGNIIAFNGEEGVLITAAPDIFNLIMQNSIYSNGRLGINLVKPASPGPVDPADGVTVNDPGDGDAGPNNLQNFPVITSVDVATQTINGTLNSTPNQYGYIIELFRSPACDPSGYGEGKTYIGSVTIAPPGTDSNGDVSFTLNSPLSAFGSGEAITATATDPSGNTSEFSQCFVIPTPPAPNVSVAVASPSPAVVDEDGATNLIFRFTRSDIAGALTVDFSVGGTATFGSDYSPSGATTFNASSGSVTFTDGNSTVDVTVDPTPDINPEGNETVVLTVTAGAGYNVGSPSTDTGTIQDNDACPVFFQVNSASDVGAHDAITGDGLCATGSGACTLRAAIEEANALINCGTIEINFAIGSSTITLADGQLAVEHNVNIVGPTTNSVVVDGNGASRVFTIGSDNTVSITNLTITGGNAAAGNGGGILNSGTLILNGMTLSGNSAADGGAIWSTTNNSLTLINTTISGNNASGNGAGLYNDTGQAALTNVTIAYNTANSDGLGTESGGGIFVASGDVLLHNTIVADNLKALSLSTTTPDDISGTVLASSSYNVIGTGSGGLTNSDGNHNQVGLASALLTTLQNNGGPTFTHALVYNSPAVDTGDDCVVTGCGGNSPVVTTDQRGQSRNPPPDGDNNGSGAIDIGAYERQTTETRDVPSGFNVSVDIADAIVTFPCVDPPCIGERANPASVKRNTTVAPAARGSSTLSLTLIDANGLNDLNNLNRPANLVIGNSSSPPLPAFEVTTTATYTPPATVCFYLPSITDPVFFAGLKILHREAGPNLTYGDSDDVMVEPQNPTNNFASKLVCGEVQSFSAFAIAKAVTPTAANGMVSGQILDTNGQPVEGTAVRMSGTQNRLTVTDARGHYHFDDVETNGLYVVTPSRANFTFSPAQRSFSQLGSNTEATFTGAANGGTLNPLDATEYFVRQQYVDFLGREPDEAGFNFWVRNIDSCGANDFGCREVKRIDTSAAFFLSIEFQQTGYLVYRTYQAAFGDMPNAPVPLKLSEFKPDALQISNRVVVLQDGWQQRLENNKKAFMEEFVQRRRFVDPYPVRMSPVEFVDKLFANAGVPSSDSDYAASIEEFGRAADTSDVPARARVLRRIAENSFLARRKFNQAFVLMEYFGYLNRDPNSGQDADFTGYNFWLDKLNRFDGNFREAEMVKAFLNSIEYRDRFPR